MRFTHRRLLRRSFGAVLPILLLGAVLPYAHTAAASSDPSKTLLATAAAGLRQAPSVVPRTAEALMIGDSILAAVDVIPSARAALAARHSFVMDAKVCRRLITLSCPSNGVIPTNALQALRADTGTYDVLVMEAGYNDSTIGAGIDAIVAEARARRIPRILWVDFRVAGPNAAQYANHNAALADRRTRYAELSIIDWNGFSSGHDDWASVADGIHLTPLGARAMAGLLADALDASASNARCSAGTSDVVPVAPPSTQAVGGGVSALDPPVRVLDTRQFPGPVARHGVVAVDVAGHAGVPAEARAVTATVTAVSPCGTTFLSAFPCAGDPAAASVVNAAGTSTVANSAIVRLDGQGRMCVYSDAPADVLVDITGWLDPAAAGMAPLNPPVRLVDTRPGAVESLDVAQRRLEGGQTLAVAVGRFGAAVATPGVTINLTSVAPAADGYLSVYPGPCSRARPEVSNLNVAAGHTAAAGATVAVGSDSNVCVFSSVTTDVIVDLDAVVRAGWAVSDVVAPRRLVDTRPTTRVDAGRILAVDLDDPAVDAPSGATGLMMNLTAVGPSNDGYLTVFPCVDLDAGSSVRPEVSSLNVSAGEIVANSVIVAAGIGRRVCIFSSTETHVLVDVEAWLTG